MRALPCDICNYRPGERIGEPGHQRIASEAVTINAADEFRDSIADHRPVSHSFGRSETGSACIVRVSEAGNNSATFGHFGHGF